MNEKQENKDMTVKLEITRNKRCKDEYLKVSENVITITIKLLIQLKTVQM